MYYDTAERPAGTEKGADLTIVNSDIFDSIFHYIMPVEIHGHRGRKKPDFFYSFHQWNKSCLKYGEIKEMNMGFLLNDA